MRKIGLLLLALVLTAGLSSCGTRKCGGNSIGVCGPAVKNNGK